MASSSKNEENWSKSNESVSVPAVNRRCDSAAPIIFTYWHSIVEHRFNTKQCFTSAVFNKDEEKRGVNGRRNKHCMLFWFKSPPGEDLPPFTKEDHHLGTSDSTANYLKYFKKNSWDNISPALICISMTLYAQRSHRRHSVRGCLRPLLSSSPSHHTSYLWLSWKLTDPVPLNPWYDSANSSLTPTEPLLNSKFTTVFISQPRTRPLIGVCSRLHDGRCFCVRVRVNSSA